MKIIDSFLYFNEREIAEFRVNYLKKNVSFFVVTEIGATHTGVRRDSCKPEAFDSCIESGIMSYKFYTYADLKNMYGDISYKISQDPWFLEYEHRRLHDKHLRDFLINNKKLINHSDVILLSDADEVPSKAVLFDIEGQIIQHVNNGRISMDWFIGSFFFKYTVNWPGTVFYTVSNFNKTSFNSVLSFIHTKRNLSVCNVFGGRHLTYFGDASNIKNKLNSIAESANKRVRLFKPFSVILLRLGIDPFARLKELPIEIQENNNKNILHGNYVMPYNSTIRYLLKPIVYIFLYMFLFLFSVIKKNKKIKK